MFLSKTPSDSAVVDCKADQLGRSGFVEGFARLVTRFAKAEGSNIFALYGEWGSGKTSVLNMLVGHLATSQPEIVVITFNPWSYSGDDRIFEGFFIEILTALNREPVLSKVAGQLSKLADGLIGLGAGAGVVAGGDVSGAAAVVATTAAAGGAAVKTAAKATEKLASQSLRDRRLNVERALVRAKRPILIVVDDLDRLPPAQLAQVFQLVRVNASLPFINYLLLLDRSAAEASLTKMGFSLSYLEKIVQFGVDLPPPAPEALLQMTRVRVMNELGVSADRYKERLDSVIKVAAPFITTPRSVVRTTGSFAFHLGFFREGAILEVDPLDLFLLEVLRCQAPKAYAFIREGVGRFIMEDRYLTILESIGPEPSDASVGRRAQVDKIAEQIGGNPGEAFEQVIEELVPGFLGRPSNEVRSLAETRLSSAAHFRTYFELTAPREHPTQSDIQKIRDSFAKPGRTNAAVLPLFDRFHWETVVNAVQVHFKDETSPTAIVALSAALWAADKLRLDAEGVGAPLLRTAQVADFALGMLGRVSDQGKRGALLEEIYQKSKHVGAFCRAVAVEQFGIHNDPKYEPCIAPTELKRLRAQCAALSQKVIDSETAVDDPMLTWHLSWKSQVDGPDAVRSWASGLLRQPDRLRAFLRHIAVMQQVNESKSSKLVITKAQLKKYFEFGPELLAALQPRPTVDTPDEAHLTEYARRVVDNAINGVADPWDGVDERAELSPQIPGLI